MKKCSKKNIFQYIKPDNCFDFYLIEAVETETSQRFRQISQLILANEKCEMDLFVKYLLKSFQYAKSTLKKKVSNNEDYQYYIMNYKSPVLLGSYDEENPNLLNYQTDDGKIHGVQYLNFLFPWSISAAHEVKYLELDCSFCLKPYVFSILTGIIDNESIPLSLSIGPSEKSEMAFDERKQFEIDLSILPVLSDIGTAIEKFCAKNNITNHFWCWRHIIESFGAHTFVSLIIRRILKCNSFNDFESSLIESCLDMLNLKVDEKTMEKFTKFVGYDYDLNQNSISKNQHFENIKKWAIWERYAYSVTTCSNHIESMHHVVKTDAKPFTNLYHKLRTILSMLELHVKEFP